MKNPQHHFIIDPFALAHQQKILLNTFPLRSLERLCENLPEQTASVTWQAEGLFNRTSDYRGRPQIKLQASTTLQLHCEACDRPYTYNLQAQTVLELARNSKELEAFEASYLEMGQDQELAILTSNLLGEDCAAGYAGSAFKDSNLQNPSAAVLSAQWQDLFASPDVILATVPFDLSVQIEDELILAMPIVLRHEGCDPIYLGSSVKTAADEPKKSPFAILSRLKKTNE